MRKGYQEDYAVNFRKALENGIKIAAGTDSGPESRMSTIDIEVMGKKKHHIMAV